MPHSKEMIIMLNTNLAIILSLLVNVTERF